MMNEKKIFATELDGVIYILGDPRCSQAFCREYGCVFPDCADMTAETYNTLEDAKAIHPNLELV